MNKIKTTRGILSAVIMAAALGLVACGGGGSAGSIESALPAGAVFTAGDGVNLAEYNTVICGMPKAEVRRIVADAPTTELEPLAIVYIMGEFAVSFYFTNNLITDKLITKGRDTVDSVKC